MPVHRINDLLTSMINGDLTVEFMQLMNWITWGSQGWILTVVTQDTNSKAWNSGHAPEEFKGRPVDESRHGKAVGIMVIFSPIHYAQNENMQTLMEYNRKWIEAYAPSSPTKNAACPYKWLSIFDEPRVLMDEYAQ